MSQQTQAARFYLDNKAHTEKELKPLLLPYISTRLYVYFNHKELSKRKRTFYANEHRCTYTQCLRGMVPNITLHKSAGYQGLVDMAASLRTKCITAKLYLRPEGSEGFDVLLWEYYQGELVKQPTEAPFEKEECKLLYYYLKDGRLIVTDTDPASEDFKINLQ
jgi:hypothetical protein